MPKFLLVATILLFTAFIFSKKVEDETTTEWFFDDLQRRAEESKYEFNYGKRSRNEEEVKMGDKQCYYPGKKTFEEVLKSSSLFSLFFAYCSVTKGDSFDASLTKEIKDWKFVKKYDIPMVFGKRNVNVGFVIKNSDKKLISFIFRGTTNDAIDGAYNVVDNLVGNPWGKGKVHAGYAEVAKKMVDNTDLRSIWREYYEKGYTLVFSGHSKGSCVAQLIARAARKHVPSAEIIIAQFAGARTGDYEFANEMNKLIPQNIRVQNGDDAVVVNLIHKPKFYHTGKRYMIRKPNGKLCETKKNIFGDFDALQKADPNSDYYKCHLQQFYYENMVPILNLESSWRKLEKVHFNGKYCN